MRILLIKPKQIGDSIVLTPTILGIKEAYPDAEIWVVVRKGCDGILIGCPAITRILTVAAVEKRDRKLRDLWTELGTVWELFTHHFDFAFELGDGNRGRNLMRLVSRKGRFSVKPTDARAEESARKAGCKISTFDWQTCHRVQKDFYTVGEFLPLPKVIPPLCFDPGRMQEWAPGKTLTDFCLVQVGSRQGFNRWNREGWREVCRGLLQRFSRVVISCGPVVHEREEAAALQSELGSNVLDTQGRTSWPELAWLLSRAQLYVGPNTAAMHLAAACRCPVVALFGPSIEDHWHPWQVPYRIVTSPGYAPVAGIQERYAQIKKRTMNEIVATDVLKSCDELLSEVGSR
jgi:heptosyltransferase-3